MRKAIATLAIGAQYQKMFRTFARPTWGPYARLHGYDIVCITRPIDESPRASARSPAWQKLLILGTPTLAGFDTVVWLDTDIVINHAIAPCIAAATPNGKLGICERTAIPDHPLFSLMRASLEKLEAEHERQSGASGGMYVVHGFANPPERIFNTGVMVLRNPGHRAFLEHVYNTYEDKGPGGGLEMGPLSYEIASGAVESEILDPKFNAILNRLAAAFGNIHQKADLFVDGRVALIASMLSKVYFLHFAGRPQMMNLLHYITVRDGIASVDSSRVHAAIKSELP